MILTMLSKGRFRDQAYFSLCMHCLFGISGLKMHTVARAWTAVLEEWNWSFLRKLCVTIFWWLFIVGPHVDTSVSNGGFEGSTSHKCNLNFSYIFKSFSLSVSVGFRLRALNPIILWLNTLVCLIVIFQWSSTFHFVQHESQTFLNPHWTIRKPGLCFSSEIIDLFWDLIESNH